jgi:hypothetical protein
MKDIKEINNAVIDQITNYQGYLKRELSAKDVYSKEIFNYLANLYPAC